MRLLTPLLFVASLTIASAAPKITITAGKSGTSTDGSRNFPTLQAARDHLRTLPLEKRAGATITLPPSTYHFTETLTLTKKDSGTAQAPITYRAAPGTKAIFDGSLPVPSQGITKVADEATLTRLAKTAHGKIYSIPILDPKLQKILARTTATDQLLISGHTLLTQSRFPNIGFVHAKELLEKDEATRWQKKPIKGTKETPNGALFTLRETPAATWQQWEKEIASHNRGTAFGYISAQWYREAMPIHSIHPEKKAIRYLTQSRYGLEEIIHKFQSRLAVKYLLCEIDSPGEWYFDSIENRLFLWPTPDSNPTDPKLTLAAGPTFLHIKNASHIRIENLTIQGISGGKTLIDINGSHNTIAGCTLRNSNGLALNISGTHNHATSLDVYDVSRFARLAGGKSSPSGITHGKNRIINSHFYLDKLTSVAPTVGISGAGNSFENNLMHNLPGQAIVFRGNNQLIARNEFFNIGFEEGDGACIYSGAEFWGYGTKIENNFLHHIMSTDGLMTRSGIMLDDHDSGREVLGNIFFKTGHGSLAINGGTGLNVENNIFLEGNHGVWIRIIGNVKERMEMQSKFDSGELRRGDKHDYIWRCQQVVGTNGWNSEYWSNQFPRFPKVMNQTGINGRFWPMENTVTNTYGHGMKNALTYIHPKAPQEGTTFTNTQEITPDWFVSYDTMDFRPTPSKADTLPKIPFESIGLQHTTYRPTPPNKATYRKLVRDQFRHRKSCNRNAKYDFENVNETIYWNSGAILSKM